MYIQPPHRLYKATTQTVYTATTQTVYTATTQTVYTATKQTDFIIQKSDFSPLYYKIGQFKDFNIEIKTEISTT